MVNYVSKFSNNNVEYILKDSNAVHKTGDETIGGNKTFSQQPRYSGTTAASSTQDSTALATVGYLNNPELSLNVVHRTGDETITGSKTFTQFTHYKTNIAYDETPSLNNYGGFNFVDKNDSEISAFYTGLFTNGNGLSGFNLKNKSGDTKGLFLRYDASGTFYTEAPTPATSDNSTKIATTAFVKSVLSSSGNGLATFNKSSNGYIEFANGIIMQWGRGSGIAQDGTITFPTPFSIIGQVTLTQLSSTDTAYHVFLSAITTTNFKVKRHGGAPDNFSWIAIGY